MKFSVTIISWGYGCWHWLYCIWLWLNTICLNLNSIWPSSIVFGYAILTLAEIGSATHALYLTISMTILQWTLSVLLGVKTMLNIVWLTYPASCSCMDSGWLDHLSAIYMTIWRIIHTGGSGHPTMFWWICHYSVDKHTRSWCAKWQ